MSRRFQFGLGLILLGFCVIGALITYFYEKQFFAQEARQKAELVMSTVDSSRAYIREVLRPRMYDLVGRDHFIIEAMSTSFATRVIMERLRVEQPHIQYRRVAVNARNPDFEANSFELEKIAYFQANPDVKNWFGLVEDGKVPAYLMVRPVRFSSSCMHCHGERQDAPLEVIQLYGELRGFGKHDGEIAGLQGVAISAESQLEIMRGSAIQVFSLILLTVFFLYAVIGLFFDLLVTRKVRGVLSLFQESLTDPKGQEIYRLTSGDGEFQDLRSSAELMADHLARSRLELERYNRELESMVAERTEALKRYSDRLANQMRERNRELDLLNLIAELTTRGMQLKRILPAALHGVLQIVPAQGAGIYLLQKGDRKLQLHCRENGPELLPELSIEGDTGDPQFLREALAEKLCGSLATETSVAGVRVPLCCRGRLQGVMILSGIGIEDLDDSRHDLLLSVGRQIGITVESLGAIDRLRDSKELLQTVFDAIADPLAMVDKEGRVLMVNEPFLRYSTEPVDQILKQNLALLTLSARIPFDRAFSKTGIQPGSGKYKGQGGRNWEIVVYPVAGREEGEEAYVCFARDITEELIANRRIEQTERLASVGQLAAGVAHEINNPLGVILCYTDILRKGGGNESLEKDLDVIERQARGCQRIVGDLLDFARPHDPVRKRVDLPLLVAEVVEFFATEIRHREITVHTTFPDALPQLLLDRGQIRQVLVNLVMNAVQAIGNGGRLEISIEQTGSGETLLAISDSGQGIAPDNIGRIFDPFFTTKGVDEGTGLGLSLSYGIIRDHGGTIEVQSVVGEGSRFTVEFPGDVSL